MRRVLYTPHSSERRLVCIRLFDLIASSRAAIYYTASNITEVQQEYGVQTDKPVQIKQIHLALPFLFFAGRFRFTGACALHSLHHQSPGGTSVKPTHDRWNCTIYEYMIKRYITSKLTHCLGQSSSFSHPIISPQLIC